ncbi:MAG: hypothetical protein WB948_08915, partial [Desulfobaccales bacterium]
MAYEKCAEVSQELWGDLEERDSAEVTGRTGVIFREGEYELPFLDRELLINPARRQVRVFRDWKRTRGSGPASWPSPTCCIWSPRAWGPSSAPWNCREGPPFSGAITCFPTPPWKPGSA